MPFRFKLGERMESAPASTSVKFNPGRKELTITFKIKDPEAIPNPDPAADLTSPLRHTHRDITDDGSGSFSDGLEVQMFGFGEKTKLFITMNVKSKVPGTGG